MILVKNKSSIAKMEEAGRRLATLFIELEHKNVVKAGASTASVDAWVEERLAQLDLVSRMKGYMGYRHVSCISINDEVVHGVPHKSRILQDGDLVKVDICASWRGYCADMARVFFVGKPSEDALKLARVARAALDKGIEKARPGNRLSDISAAIQQEVERHGFGVVRDFAGHGIGKQMHEDPEVLNYGEPGEGPILRQGMAFALEPMITFGSYDVFVTEDDWTVKTEDKSLAAHVEDTVVITDGEPKVITKTDFPLGGLK